MYRNTTPCNISNNYQLLSTLIDANISISEISDSLDKMRKMKEIEQKYANKIKTRKDGRQYYIYINRKQYTATSLDKLYQLLYEREYGFQNWSMADVYPLWMKWKRDNTAVVGNTLKINKKEWENYIEPFPIANIPLKNLTSKDFTDLFRNWTKKRSMTLKKFNNLKSLINGIFSYAITELKIVNINPIQGIDRKQFSFKPVNNDDDVFTISDRRKILDYLSSNDDMYSLAIQFDFHMILRIGELLSLKWSDLSGDYVHAQSQLVRLIEMNDDLSFTKTVYESVDHIKGNTAEGFRYLPITPETKIILEKVRSQNPNGIYVFMKDGKRLTAKTFNRHLEKYCKSIGIVPRTSHKIRFTVASILYTNGMDITDLQRLLGHSSSTMTMHYLRKVTPPHSTAKLMAQCLG